MESGIEHSGHRNMASIAPTMTYDVNCCRITRNRRESTEFTVLEPKMLTLLENSNKNILDFAIWSILKKMVLMNEVPENLQGLEVLMREAWEKLTPDYIAKSCLNGVQHRVAKMMQAEVGRFELS